MDKWSLERVSELLEDCGRLAMEMSRDLKPELKADRSIVTNADKAIEALLAKEFDRPSEGVYMIGEETSSSKSQEYVERAMKGTAWVVDPIDGTAPFAYGIPLWGTSIGFMQGGVLKEGAVFMPVLGEMLGSENGTTYHADLGPSGVPRKGFAKALEKIGRPKTALDDGAIINVSQRMARGGLIRMPNPVHSLCSCVYSMASLAMGRHIAYVFSAKAWDAAGSLPALRNLGFAGVLENGRDIMDLKVSSEAYELPPNAKSPWHLRSHAIIAADKEVVDAIMAKCQFP